MPIIAPFEYGSHCMFAGFLDDTPCYATADGIIHAPTWSRAIQAADGGFTAVAMSSTSDCLLTGGEDGTVRRLSNHFNSDENDTAPKLDLLAKLEDGKWIDCLAAAPQDGGFAFSSGRKLYFGMANSGNHEEADKEKGYPTHEWTLDNSVEGLNFGPKGLRLAVARYNGVTLYWPNTTSAPVNLEWKGAHTGVVFSPDRRFIVTTMQENALHGWRLEDGQHLRMSGYPAKVKSLSWSAKGRYLATSGAPAAIVWPFMGRDGPMNKAPLELGTRGDTMVTCVACHPAEDMVAIGYADGMILLVRFNDSKESVLRHGGKGEITSMHWDKPGARLAFGADSGEAGLIDLSE